MSKLSLDVIQLVNLIKDSGSFSNAAEKMHRTPSAISYRVSNVEKMLGVKLFKRNGPFVELSKTGQLIASEGISILNAIDNLEDRLCIGKHNHHVLRIGLSDNLSLNFIPRLLKVFMSENTGLKVEVRKFPDGKEWETLCEGEIDIVFSPMPAPANVPATNVLMYINKYVCCANPTYWERVSRSVDNKNPLEACILISNEKSPHADPFTNTFMNPAGKIMVNDTAMQLDLILGGCGIGVIPLQCAKELIKKEELITLSVEGSQGTDMTWAGWHGHSSRYARWWQENLQKLSTELYG